MTYTQNHIIIHIMNKLVVFGLLTIMCFFSCERTKKNKSLVEETYGNYIQFDDFSISNIITSGSYCNLIKKYGEPDRSYEFLFITDRYSKEYNITILVYQNKGLEYFRFKDSVQLYSVNLDLCKTININLYDKRLNRKISTHKFCKYYNYDMDYITAVDADWTHYPDTSYGYELLWVTDSVNKGCMEFYFDGNKKLKYINFGLKNGGILQ